MPIEPVRIHEARVLLSRHFAPTRLVHAASLSDGDRHVYLKLESELPTGSFKVRGAVYALSLHVAHGGPREVVAASTGNHGAAVAYAGHLMSVPATIFLPAHANPAKVARIREQGGRIVEGGADLTSAINAAADYAARAGALFLHDATHPDIPVGTATIGAEILSQLSSTDAIVVPMGDTALIRGVASAAKSRKPALRIVGVVAERAPAYYLSWQKRTPVVTASPDTMADGLAVNRPLAENVAAIVDLVDEVRLVGEEDMRAAMAFLLAMEHVVAEPAGAAATAAIRARPPSGNVIVALVTGSNIAPDLLP